MSTPVFPTRHGDWHLIGGELVDLSQADTNPPEPSPAATPTATSTSSLPPFSPPASKRRNKPSSED